MIEIVCPVGAGSVGFFSNRDRGSRIPAQGRGKVKEEVAEAAADALRAECGGRHDPVLGRFV